jgi:hypothetical protein
MALGTDKSALIAPSSDPVCPLRRPVAAAARSEERFDLVHDTLSVGVSESLQSCNHPDHLSTRTRQADPRRRPRRKLSTYIAGTIVEGRDVAAAADRGIPGSELIGDRHLAGMCRG